MANEKLRRFVLSWDLEKNPKMNAEEFRIALIKILLYNNCIDLKSYTNSCIYFTSKYTTLQWNDVLFKQYSEILTFNISEVVKDSSGQFEIYGWYFIKHANDFDQLVADVKSGKS